MTESARSGSDVDLDDVAGATVTDHEDTATAEIQVWSHSPGSWVTVDERPKAEALAVAQRLAAIDPDVRVAKDGESIARWVFGQRTIR